MDACTDECRVKAKDLDEDGQVAKRKGESGQNPVRRGLDIPMTTVLVERRQNIIRAINAIPIEAYRSPHRENFRSEQEQGSDGPPSCLNYASLMAPSGLEKVTLTDHGIPVGGLDRFILLGQLIHKDL